MKQNGGSNPDKRAHQKKMTQSTQIKLFQVFKAKFGEQEAEQIVSLIENTVENKFDEKKEVLLTKDDKVELIKEIRDSIKWMVGIFITLALMIIGLYIRK